MLENYIHKIFIEAITSNHDLLWLITWSISWVGWQIQYSLSIHDWFQKINVILVHIWKVFFTLYVTLCTRVMVVNEFGTRFTVLLFVTNVLGTCTWFKKYLMYLMPSKYCEYLYLYLQSTCTWLKYCQKYLTPTLNWSYSPETPNLGQIRRFF